MVLKSDNHGQPIVSPESVTRPETAGPSVRSSALADFAMQNVWNYSWSFKRMHSTALGVDACKGPMHVLLFFERGVGVG